MELFTILVISVIIMLILLNKYYAFGIVKGISMLPTLKNFEPIIIKRRCVIESGKIYLIKVDGEVIVKRLTDMKLNYVSGKLSLFFVGDNKENSYDSRDFGWREDTVIIGEVIKILR